MSTTVERQRPVSRRWSFRTSPPNGDREPPRNRSAWARQVAEYIYSFRPTLTEVSTFAFGGLVIVIPALVAIATAGWLRDIQIEVSSLSVPQRANGGQVTTMAWTTREGGPLTVGTADGFLINVRRDGTTIEASEAFPQRYAAGPIVNVHPSNTDATADATWVSTIGRFAGYRVGSEASHRGFAYRVDDSLKAVPPLDALPIARQISSKVTPDAPQLTAIATVVSRAGLYIVTGYESGAVAVLPASAQTEVFPTQPSDLQTLAANHIEPVLAIATHPTPNLVDDARFATAAADGTVSVHELSAGKEVHESRAVFFEPDLGASRFESRVASTGLIPRRDGLMLDHSGRTLLLWDQGGGISVARLDGQQPPVFQRYPLTGVPHTKPDRSVSAVQFALKTLGLYEGPLDGIVGPQTNDALSSFRARTGLEQIPISDIQYLAAVLLPATWATSAVALSPRGNLFAVAGADAIVRIVMLPADPTALPSTAKTVDLLGHSSLVTRLAISPDGSFLASLDSTGRVLVTNLERLLSISSLPLAAFSTVPRPMELSPLPTNLAQRFVVCEGQFESRCKPYQYDIFVSCYQVDIRISEICEGSRSERVQVRRSMSGNRCGYSWYLVSC